MAGSFYAAKINLYCTAVPLRGSGTDLLKENTLLPAPTRGDYLLQTKAQSIISWMVGSNTGLQLRSPKWALEIIMSESFVSLKNRALIAVSEYRSEVETNWRADDGGLTWAAGDELNSCNYAVDEVEAAVSSNDLLCRLDKALPSLHVKELPTSSKQGIPICECAEGCGVEMTYEGSDGDWWNTTDHYRCLMCGEEVSQKHFY